MKKIILVLICVFIAGCASDPEKRRQVAITESSLMRPTIKSLESFDNFKLTDMTLASSMESKPEKVEVAKILEGKLKAKLDPLISSWNTKSGQLQNGRTVEIRPKIISLRVISGTTRFFAGAFAGQSEIRMDLILVDGETGVEVGRTRIQRSADSFAGAWSIGMTDKSLLDYIVDIAYQYLIDNYKEEK